MGTLPRSQIDEILEMSAGLPAVQLGSLACCTTGSRLPMAGVRSTRGTSFSRMISDQCGDEWRLSPQPPRLGVAQCA